MINKILAGAVMSVVAIAANAQSNNASSTTSVATQSGSTSNNQGNSLTNNFTSPSDTHSNIDYGGTYHVLGNTAVGLGSFAGSFSPDYCGGTAQFGLSVPGATVAAGVPVKGAVGDACVKLRAVERTMQVAASFGTAAQQASNAKDQEGAQFYATESRKLAASAEGILCTLDPDVRQVYKDNGIACPLSEDERKAKNVQAAAAKGEPVDPIVRYREGYASIN